MLMVNTDRRNFTVSTRACPHSYPHFYHDF